MKINRKMDEVIAKLQEMFDEVVDIKDEQDYVAASCIFIDQCLIAVDEAKRFVNPMPERNVLRQLDRVKKALENLGPEARDHIVGYIPDISAPCLIEEFAARTEGYSSRTARNAQQRRLLHMAEAIWPGKVSKYQRSRFSHFVSYLSKLAGMPAPTDDFMRKNVGQPTLPRISPNSF
jgi:hypothetical protein